MDTSCVLDMKMHTLYVMCMLPVNQFEIYDSLIVVELVSVVGLCSSILLKERERERQDKMSSIS